MAMYFIGSFGLLLGAIYISSWFAIPFLLWAFVGYLFRLVRCPNCEEPIAFMTIKILWREYEMVRPFFPKKCPHCDTSLK